MTAPTRVPTRAPALAGAGGLTAGIAAEAADGSGWRWAEELGHYPAA